MQWPFPGHTAIPDTTERIVVSPATTITEPEAVNQITNLVERASYVVLFHI